MSIKFSCPHCSKALNVKDHLAGKKAQCPGCKQILRIPGSKVPGSHEVEALAAAAFADADKDVPEQPETKIEFACPMCDEKISVNAALAGKQAPCPECRRIIKVPLLKKQEAKDWRKIDPRASTGIRLSDAQAMEGTWGTDSAGKVSRQALIEAQVIPTEKERLSWQGWVKRSLIGVVAVGFILTTAGIIWRITRANKRDAAFRQGMALVDEKPSKLPSPLLAVGHQLAGEYYLKLNDLEKARMQFQTARAEILQGVSNPTERDLALINLATEQFNLSGNQTQLDRKERLKPDELQKDIRRTVDEVKTPEGRRIAIKSSARQYLSRGDWQHAAELAGLFPEDKAELEGIVGLELFRDKKEKEAETLATSAQQGMQPPPVSAANQAAPGAKQASPAPNIAPSLVALLYGLGQAGKARALAPEGKVPVDVRAKYQIGSIWGLGLDGKYPAALAAVKELPAPAFKVQALSGLAEFAFDAGQKDDARSMVDEAAKLVEAEKAKEMSSWMLWRLAVLAAKVGAAETGQAIARQIADPPIRQQAVVDLLAAGTTADKLDAALGSSVDKNSPIYALALAEACRRQANQGDSANLQKAISTWEPEKLRAIGYLGLALGLQEHNQ